MNYEDAKRELETIRDALNRLGIRTGDGLVSYPDSESVLHIPLGQALKQRTHRDGCFKIYVGTRRDDRSRCVVALDLTPKSWREIIAPVEELELAAQPKDG